MEAVKVFTRYDYHVVGEVDGEPETRRMFNERLGFSDKNPDLYIPKYAEFLWSIFIDLIGCVYRVDGFSGFYHLIPPSEFKAYNDLKQLNLLPYEYEILSNMDKVFCEELNKDINAKQERKKSDNEHKLKRKR